VTPRYGQTAAVNAIREVTGSTVDAIRKIGTTIWQMNEIASPIATAARCAGTGAAFGRGDIVFV